MISLFDLTNLVQRSEVIAKDKTKQIYESSKPLIIASLQSQYHLFQKQEFIQEPKTSDELSLAIKNCNLSKEVKAEIIRRLS